MARMTPYDALPKSAFWRSGVVEASPFDLQELYSKKFDILPETKIATGGSCFAQLLSRRLRAHGYSFLDVEPAPAWLPREQHLKYGFSTYSARYGNIYTIPQLRQLAQEAAGTFEPQNICWQRDGKFYDALRPAVEPDGLESEAELRLHRQFHVDKVRVLFASMDLFIFTLGLTEAWRHKKSGTVYPTAPGVFAGEFDDAEYEFVNFSFGDIERAFDEFLSALKAIRGDRPLPKVLLTVSPVPMTATASGRHVLQANTYTKSLLRTFAGQLAAQHGFIDYFPSYEIVVNQAARGVFYENNLRSIRTEGVDTVMKVFFASHAPAAANVVPLPEAEKSSATAAPRQKLDAEIQCEEAILEAFA